MLLFSTLLEINNELTKDAFIQLVLEWNESNPYVENIIPGIVWNGERNICYQANNLKLEIEEYRNQNLIAVRYEKVEENGVIWDTDYVMNFTDMKMSIQLDRSYTEDAWFMNPDFSTPYFISLLVAHGYLTDDGNLPVLQAPIAIDESNVDSLAAVINGDAHYNLPIVYVSKTTENQDPVDVLKIAKRLKGVAHILVEGSVEFDPLIRKLTDSKNEFHGAIGLYFPNMTFGNKRFIYRPYDGVEKNLTKKITDQIIQYCNSQRIDILYTWQGVSNALLRDRLDSKVEKLLHAETEKEKIKNETDKMIESVDEEIEGLKQQIQELTNRNEALMYENQGLRNKLSKTDQIPVLFLGEEDEFFPNEIKEILLTELEKAMDNLPDGSRRKDILTDLVNNNECERVLKDKGEEIKKILKGFKSLTGPMKQKLEELGFVISDDGKHYKLTYYGDERYMVTVGKTPSDQRAGMNNAAEIIKMML